MNGVPSGGWLRTALLAWTMAAGGLTAAIPARSPAAELPPGQPDGMHLVSGRYHNAAYGFSISVPRAARGYVSNGPDHGVLLVLGGNRTITVSAIQADPDFIRGTLCGREKLLDRPRGQQIETRSIGGEPACAVISDTRYDYFELRQQMRDDHGKRVLYAMRLETVPQWEAADLQVFDALADDFTRIAISR